MICTLYYVNDFTRKKKFQKAIDAVKRLVTTQ